ncbi:plant basic secretory protein [Penicillium capsulatum]|uniref:Plant basic secretory protein n=1 Tax=Penicillium capsulatum TaxID=69766 RepID=A0A9W9IVN3_9EURO|nr:plant basic secretory protein [Penicillium capsulatum]KAJ6129490.1 plant basic secretory protein [Penicillium capsulatum]
MPQAKVVFGVIASLLVGTIQLGDAIYVILFNKLVYPCAPTLFLPMVPHHSKQQWSAESVYAPTKIICPKNHSFCQSIIPDIEHIIPRAFQTIQDVLYTSPSVNSAESKSKFRFNPFIPAQDLVTIYLSYFEESSNPHIETLGYTKVPSPTEVHINFTYFEPSAKQHVQAARWAFMGTITHELTHVFAHEIARPQNFGRLNARQHAFLLPPLGLLEGIATYVQLHGGAYLPPIRSPRSSEQLTRWDAGYDETAMFLLWLETVKFEPGVVGLINDRILRVGYVREGEHEFWKSLFGVTIEQLWREYSEYVDSPK